MNNENMELCKAAYDAYCIAVGGQAFNGDDLPEFESLPPNIMEAWEAAVVAVGYKVATNLTSAMASTLRQSADTLTTIVSAHRETADGLVKIPEEMMLQIKAD